MTLPMTSQELEQTVATLIEVVQRLEQRVIWLEEITGKRSLAIHRSPIYPFDRENHDAAEEGSQARLEGF